MDFLKIFSKERIINLRAIKGTKIIGITRIRNEELILQDTLDHMASIVDVIYAYDDCSTDKTISILKKHPKVSMIISNKKWMQGDGVRPQEETRSRSSLLELARNKNPEAEWFFYFDADERFIGSIRESLLNGSLDAFDGIKIRLFDAYMTAEDSESYQCSMPLLGFRKNFGPEYRDILMIWKNRKEAKYEGIDAREPNIYSEKIKNEFYCQHYGKSLSIDQWEETCDYYIKHFPYETYGKKWESRKGKAIHTKSDFGNPLYLWGEDLFKNGFKI